MLFVIASKYITILNFVASFMLPFQPQWMNGATASRTVPAVQPTPTAASGVTTRSASLRPATAAL